jgi:hypothetical protein
VRQRPWVDQPLDALTNAGRLLRQREGAANVCAHPQSDVRELGPRQSCVCDRFSGGLRGVVSGDGRQEVVAL